VFVRRGGGGGGGVRAGLLKGGLGFVCDSSVGLGEAVRKRKGKRRRISLGVSIVVYEQLCAGHSTPRQRSNGKTPGFLSVVDVCQRGHDTFESRKASEHIQIFKKALEL